MNETINSILSRRSIRKFKPESIGQNELESIIMAGLSAPSTLNQRSWDFTVLRSKEKNEFLNTESKKAMTEKNQSNPQPHIIYNAPVVMIVSFAKDAMLPMADCSAAIQNMQLAAHSLGIGSCWIGGSITYFTSGVHNAEFNIPETHNPFFTIAFGYPDGEPGKMTERKIDTVRYID